MPELLEAENAKAPPLTYPQPMGRWEPWWAEPGWGSTLLWAWSVSMWEWIIKAMPVFYPTLPMDVAWAVMGRGLIRIHIMGVASGGVRWGHTRRGGA